MKKFVFWTGMISILGGTVMQFPGFSGQLMPSEQSGMLLHLFGLMAIFLGIMLFFCSRDLGHRGNLVIWEGILRLSGFVAMACYGIFVGGGIQVAMGGIFDLIVGMIYLVALPRYLGVSFTDLLLDRQVAI